MGGVVTVIGGTMRNLFCGLAFVVLAAPVLNHAQLKKADRPVFRSVKRVTNDCRTFLKIFPDGKPLPDDEKFSITVEQMGAAAACKAYIEGVQDEEMENAFGEKYHPVPSRLESFGTLVNTFIKYADDHPEQGDFAASTLLEKSMRLIVETQNKPRMK
jgi:hypothetical protein